MAKIKPLSLEEIQRNLGRPSMQSGTTSEMYKYMSRLSKTVNSRIRRLSEHANLGSYSTDNLERELINAGLGSAITMAGFIRVGKEGEYNREELQKMIKAAERFISTKKSTITGIKELRAGMVAGLNESMQLGLSDEEAEAVSEAYDRMGLSENEYYEIVSIIKDSAESGHDLNHVIALVDTHVRLVDEELEPVITMLYNNIKNN